MDIPIVADTNHALARAFGCLKEDEGIAYRGLYIIDNKGQTSFFIRHLLCSEYAAYHMPFLGHFFLTSLGMSQVTTVQAWEGQTQNFESLDLNNSESM